MLASEATSALATTVPTEGEGADGTSGRLAATFREAREDTTLTLVGGKNQGAHTKGTVESLWREFHEALRAFFKKRVRDPEVAEDLLQEAFLRIHQNIETVDPEANLQAWMYRIARNLVIDHYRARKTTEEFSDMPAPEPDEPNEAARVFGGCVRSMIAHLGPRYRDAINLVVVDGMTQNQAAKKLGISVSGAKSRVQRGRKQLRTLLKSCCEVEFDRRGGVIYHDCVSPCC